MLNFSEKTKILMERKDYRQNELAEKLKITRQGLGAKFKKNNFTEQEMKEVAEALNLTLKISFLDENGNDFLTGNTTINEDNYQNIDSSKTSKTQGLEQQCELVDVSEVEEETDPDVRWSDKKSCYMYRHNNDDNDWRTWAPGNPPDFSKME